MIKQTVPHCKNCNYYFYGITVNQRRNAKHYCVRMKGFDFYFLQLLAKDIITSPSCCPLRKKKINRGEI